MSDDNAEARFTEEDVEGLANRIVEGPETGAAQLKAFLANYQQREMPRPTQHNGVFAVQDGTIHITATYFPTLPPSQEEIDERVANTRLLLHDARMSEAAAVETATHYRELFGTATSKLKDLQGQLARALSHHDRADAPAWWDLVKHAHQLLTTTLNEMEQKDA
jgi:hypothetical protein